MKIILNKLIFPLFALMSLLLITMNSAMAAPYITPTQASYFPGQTATIVGYEFEPFQNLIVKIYPPGNSKNDNYGQPKSFDVFTDPIGGFALDYEINSKKKGVYKIETIDPTTIVASGASKSSGTVLANGVMGSGNVRTDLQLVSQPDSEVCTPPRPKDPTHGAADALAGTCLVGTVDLTAIGNNPTLQGFGFEIVTDQQSIHQGPGNIPIDFINGIEIVDSQFIPDSATGSTPFGDEWYVATGETIPTDEIPFTMQSIDGTWYNIQGSENGNTVSYNVTVDPILNPDPITVTTFEYCARINENAGDSDNGRDGSITSTPETGGTELSPINVCKEEVDTTPPICEIKFIDNGVQALVTDSQSGVASIEILELINATATINYDATSKGINQGDTETFDPPFTSQIIVEAVKILLGQSSSLSIQITDAAGNVTTCDPVDFKLVRGDGKPTTHTFTLTEREGYLRIDNYWLQDITMELNGHTLKFSANAEGKDVYSMPDEGAVNYGIFRYLVEGENTIEITAYGKDSGYARISISDVKPLN